MNVGYLGDFPGGPVVKTLSLQCKGCGFDPWLGNKDPAYCLVWQKKKKKGYLKFVNPIFMWGHSE